MRGNGFPEPCGLGTNGPRTRLGIPAEAPVILYVGRIAAGKGIEHLLEATRELTERISSSQGRTTATARELVQQAPAGRGDAGGIHIPGDGEPPHDLYPQADVFVLASAGESFGIVAAEAAAAGTPVVVSDRCGIAGFFQDGEALVVPYERSAVVEACARSSPTRASRAARRGGSRPHDARPGTRHRRQEEIYRERFAHRRDEVLDRRLVAPVRTSSRERSRPRRSAASAASTWSARRPPHICRGNEETVLRREADRRRADTVREDERQAPSAASLTATPQGSRRESSAKTSASTYSCASSASGTWPRSVSRTPSSSASSQVVSALRTVARDHEAKPRVAGLGEQRGQIVEALLRPEASDARARRRRRLRSHVVDQLERLRSLRASTPRTSIVFAKNGCAPGSASSDDRFPRGRADDQNVCRLRTSAGRPHP